MSPARASLEGPFSRSLREALESVAAETMVPRLIAMSLAAAGRRAVPEDAAPFAELVEGPLRTVVVQTLGHASYDVVAERLTHVLAMASSQVIPKESLDHAEIAGERDDDSSVRVVGRALARVQAQPRSALQAGPQPARVVVEEDARRAPAACRAGDTVRPPRTAPARVLVATLDPLLFAEAQSRLTGRSEVVAVGTGAELLAQLDGAGGRVALVIDTVLPSIDVPSFASLASAFPPGTIVILWGMSDRQKQRLVTMFPIAAAWIASGVAASPADLLVDDA